MLVCGFASGSRPGPYLGSYPVRVGFVSRFEFGSCVVSVWVRVGFVSGVCLVRFWVRVRFVFEFVSRFVSDSYLLGSDSDLEFVFNSYFDSYMDHFQAILNYI